MHENPTYLKATDELHDKGRALVRGVVGGVRRNGATNASSTDVAAATAAAAVAAALPDRVTGDDDRNASTVLAAKEGTPATVLLRSDAAAEADCHHKLRSQHKFLYHANEIVDPKCSNLSESVQGAVFPLHIAKVDTGGSYSNANAKEEGSLTALPLVWLFDSGVMLKMQYLKDFMMRHFWLPGQPNIWEATDEPLMMKAIGDLYHRCEAGEDCVFVFVDGGAAFGYSPSSCAGASLLCASWPSTRTLSSWSRCALRACASSSGGSQTRRA